MQAFGPLAERETWTTTLHLALDLPLGVAWFVALVAGLALTVSLAVSIILLPVAAATLVGTLAMARGIGAADRHRARVLLGLALTDPMPRPAGTGLWSSLRAAVSDPVAWKATAYGVVLLAWGIVAFSVTALVWFAPIGFLLGAIDSVDGFTPVLAVLSVLALVAAPRIVRAVAKVDAGLVGSLLAENRSAVLERRVGELEVSRDATMDASAAELRRIERDLHDGAQQRLVALAIDLGLARARLEAGADPNQAAELVERAHQEALRAVVELRELVRGIHPAVLTDRGLDAALSALAARSPVPVDIDVALGSRPSPHVEAAAYFIVAEALANVAKHSRATRAAVRVRRHQDQLQVTVTDDGVGGAVVFPGGGLSGLADRVASAEGRWHLTSPAGGPTQLAVELPCGS